MSSGTQVALLPPLRRGEAAPRLRSPERAEHPAVRFVSVCALSAYGVDRWATLLHPVPSVRLLALLCLALALVAAGRPLVRRSRLLAAVVVLLAALAVLPLAGVPLGWVVHVRVAVTATAIGNGLSALPHVLVPYIGVNQWVRLVIVLGAGVLLLGAAVMLAFEPGAPSDLRRGMAAVPLLALAVVPATIIRPQLPYLQGLLLFGLLAAFVWGERIERPRVVGAVVILAGAGVLAMIAAPAVEGHKPWLDYQALAGRLAAAKTATFDWSQGYGPILWPRTGRDVLEVKAARGDYWKAENLDIFDGRGWALGAVPGTEDPVDSVSRGALSRWTEKLQVTIRGMSTTDVIGAGYTDTPGGLSAPFVAGDSPGTWTTAQPLANGDSYFVEAYSPKPSPAQLAAAGTAYPPALLPGYLTIQIPAASQPYWAEQVLFAPFGSSLAAAYGPSTVDTTSALRASPYAPAYALALRLQQGAATPYAYVQAVMRYLAGGFTYDENPAPARYPLESFLIGTRAGYCQQFAGAMALLLRMGGVPARVAVGFTPGAYDSATRSWIVTDIDAHAWVEAWFPGYGWVRFDPTPGADPALGGRAPISGSADLGSASAAKQAARHARPGAGASTSVGRRAGSAGGLPGGAAGTALVGVGLLGLLVGLLYATRPLAGGEEEVAELERAFARSGRPLGAATTLAALERRFAASPDAAAYVRALRLARFADAASAPGARARRALRAQLRAGLGPVGRARALWALPPRRRRRLN